MRVATTALRRSVDAANSFSRGSARAAASESGAPVGTGQGLNAIVWVRAELYCGGGKAKASLLFGAGCVPSRFVMDTVHQFERVTVVETTITLSFKRSEYVIVC